MLTPLGYCQNYAHAYIIGRREYADGSNSNSVSTIYYDASDTTCASTLFPPESEIIQYSLMHTPQDVGDKEKQWLRFFKEAHYMTETDVEEKITTPSVLEAFERAKLSTLPDCVREMYAMEEAQYAQYSIHTQEQIEKGKAEGIKIGKMQVLCNLIQSMKKQNKSDKKIKKHLELSDEEFQALVGLIDS